MYAIRIFCDPEFVADETSVAYGEKLCIAYVQQYSTIYRLNTVYNVHSLIHLDDDVRRYGVLDSVSAFPYESIYVRTP